MSYNLLPFPDAPLPETWTLATYNVQDLFDTSDDPCADDPRPTENELRNKLTRLARVLHLLDADIVGLMEVETLGVLQRLNSEYLSDLGYSQAILIEGNDPERGIDVAMLSRFPVTQIVSHAGEVFTDSSGTVRRLFSRDCLECHLNLPDGQPLIVLVNHFKSKRGGEGETEGLRLAQAARVRALAEGLIRDFPLIAIVGDLNDTPEAASSQTVVGVGRDAPLADLALDVPVPARYTFVHQGVPERIDYLLVSPALAARVVPNSVFIPHDTFAARASDHDPIRATFALGNAAVPTAYPANLTVNYDAGHSPLIRSRHAVRINATRFFAHDLFALQGQTVIVTGIVRRVQETHGTGVLRLFLGHGDPERAFRVVIFPPARAEFARAGIRDIPGYYEDRMTQGVGALRFFGGSPEIAVEQPHQLRIIRQE